MHGGRVISDGVLPSEEKPGWVLDHVVALVRIPGDDRGGKNVVVVAACTR